MEVFQQCIEIIIQTPFHHGTRELAKSVKAACTAWNCQELKTGFVEVKECKSARKGDVLSRDIMIYHTGYLHDILAFQQFIGLLCVHNGLASVVRHIKPTECDFI